MILHNAINRGWEKRGGSDHNDDNRDIMTTDTKLTVLPVPGQSFSTLEHRLVIPSSQRPNCLGGQDINQYYGRG